MHPATHQRRGIRYALLILFSASFAVALLAWTLALSAATPERVSAPGAPSAAYIVTSTSDSGPGSLRAAIEAANSSLEPDTIIFDLSLPATIRLSSTLSIIGSVTINGPLEGALTIDGNNQYQILSVSGLSTHVNISNLTLTNGRAAMSGGAIYNEGGTVNIFNSTLSGNEASVDGGAIYNSDGSVNITNSTISGNHAANRGGGIFNYACNAGTTVGARVNVRSSTIVTNSANTNGGGIYNQTQIDTPCFNIAVFEVGNTILAGNVSPASPDCFNEGTFSSLGYNFISQIGPGCTFVTTDRATGPGLIFTEVVAPNLADNGGPTPTHALFPNSPAIDQIPNAIGCDIETRADQRGVLRPQGLGCDIGAYEFQIGITLTVAAEGTDVEATRTATATVYQDDDLAQPVSGKLVGFEVTGDTTIGPLTRTTDANGQAVFTYVSRAPTQALQADTPASLNDTAATDLIHVWVDLNLNDVWNVGEPEAFAALPTAITLASFSAQVVNGQVVLSWRTGAEIDNAGFNLYRATAVGGPYSQINPQLIPGQGTGYGASYTYTDSPPDANRLYYKLEDVDYYGVRTQHGPVEVRLDFDPAASSERLYLPALPSRD